MRATEIAQPLLTAVALLSGRAVLAGGTPRTVCGHSIGELSALALAGVMTEPPNGLPDLRAVIEAVEGLNRPIFGIVEQDMYPVAFDVPMPIAKRTRNYLLSCGSRTTVN